MKISPFQLERYFAKYEFSAPYLLCTSDCEPLTLKELLALADSDSLKMWEDLWLGYTESQGHPILRKEVTNFYQNIKVENVLITAPEEGVFVAMNVLVDKGDHVITTFPGYQSLYEIANSVGCELSQWKPKLTDSWKFDVEDLKKLIKPNTKLIVMNFPHNPTGSLITKEEQKAILDLAREKNIYVFSDEMYRFMEYDEKDRLPSSSDLYENAISLFGLSKTFALAGLRIGWLTTQNTDLIQKFLSFKDFTTICPSAPSEILAIIAIRAKDKIINRNLKIIQSNLKLFDDFFTRHAEYFKWLKPKAGPIAFPELKGSKDVAEFCLDLVEKKGVMILPSKVYDFEGNNFRVGFGRKNTPEALKLLEEYISESWKHVTGSNAI